MPTYEKALAELEHWMSEKAATARRLWELHPQSFIDEERFEAHRTKLQNELRTCYDEMRLVLEQLDREPNRHARHFDRLKQFRAHGSYEDSVFVMTKYPEHGDPGADALKAVIDVVREGITARGLRPRIAADESHHRWLWDNVELFLLGCARGVAVVEDRYRPELNPNVAMEWGWMVGMGRHVLFLREQGFGHDRADWAGLHSYEFDWDDPRPGIDAALDHLRV